MVFSGPGSWSGSPAESRNHSASAAGGSAGPQKALVELRNDSSIINAYGRPQESHGILLTIGGPMIRVNATGSLLQTLMAMLYFEFLGLRSGIERPSLNQ